MTLKDIINEKENIVILSGAGVSTASGLKDFRSKDGLYANQSVDPMLILSRSYYNKNPQSTIDYIVDNFIVNKEVMPNLGHEFAYDLYKEDKLLGVITQNIDGLYEKTKLPHQYIVNIHGNGAQFVCTSCFASLDLHELNENNRSHCCDSIVDTDVVLYGDNFEINNYQRYQQMIEKADLIIVMGTTLHISAHMYNVMRVSEKVLINNETLEYNNEMFQHVFIGDINDILRRQYYRKP